MSSYIDTEYWISLVISMWEENKFFIGASLGEKVNALEKSVRAQALLTAEALGANVGTLDFEYGDGDRMIFYHAHDYPDMSICQSSGGIFDRFTSGIAQDVRRLNNQSNFEALYYEEIEQLLEEYVSSLLEPVHKWYREHSHRFR